MTEERSKRAVAKRLEREDRAEREAAWLYGALGGRVPADGPPAVRAAATTIAAWLQELPSFHRGALSLRYVSREWPAPIQEEFGCEASLVVRLECALHPAVGVPVDELERAAVERLLERIAEADSRLGRYSGAKDDLRRLSRRAHKHVALAIRALGDVRGMSPCRVPVGGEPSTPAAAEVPVVGVSSTEDV